MPESTPQKVDKRIDQVEWPDEEVNDADKKTQGGVEDHETSVENLKDRVSDLEERLR